MEVEIVRGNCLKISAINGSDYKVTEVNFDDYAQLLSFVSTIHSMCFGLPKYWIGDEIALGEYGNMNGSTKEEALEILNDLMKHSYGDQPQLTVIRGVHVPVKVYLEEN